jgi:DNA segregation ATPase FtsK/SpoIIIE, S-DNA-T family
MAARRKPHESRALLPENVVVFLRRRVEELFGIVLFAISMFVFLSLGSYDVADPSLNTAVDGQTHNLCGPKGAYFADIMMQAFGWSSFVIAISILSWSWLKLLHKPLNRMMLKLLLLPLLMVSLSVGLDILTSNDPYVATKLGGAIGAIITKPLLNLLSFMSKPVALLCVGMLSLVTSAGLFAYISGIRGSQWFNILNVINSMVSFVFYYTGRILAWTLSRKSEMTPVAKKPKEVAEVKPQQTSRVAGEHPALQVVERPRAIPDLHIVRGHEEPEDFDDEEDDEMDESTFDLQQTGDYQLPQLDLLAEAQDSSETLISEKDLQEKAHLLSEVLDDFGIQGEIVKIRPGPVVTLYELVPAPGIKSSRVIGLADDIARSMCAISARVAVIPGRNAIGIELPNETRQTVLLRELLASPAYERTGGALPMALGKDISGGPIIADLTRMPHLLVAGTTGSGKSVGINSMILSLLFRLPPDRCKLIMIDPKMLELSVYDGIPHLLTPVVTDPKKAVVALKWTVREMENRYRAMSKLGVRNILGYNMRIAEAKASGEVLARKVQTGFEADTGRPIYESQTLELEPLPYIVVVVDEMADLMLVAGKDIEAAVQRLAQMARAAGIHIIMATQRPSVDVITGTIKANFPTRISFQVTSKIDSRTILGEMGAEQLLGMGDMLYMAAGGRITRVHGPFVSDQEVEKIVAYLKTQGYPNYLEEITTDSEDTSAPGVSGDGNGDELYEQALALVLREGKVSTSFIQRHLQIGYNRAARIVETMEEQGIISEASRTGKREILSASGGR